MAMDLISTGPTTTARTPDSDTETPPLKRAHLHAPPPQPVVVVVSYKECLKNHAASIGGHALDGCCEFMPGPTANLSDPTSLKCAACGCHRNFHRRDPDDPAPLHHHVPPARTAHSPPHSASQLLLSLGGGGQNGNFTRKRFRTKFSQEQKEKMHEFSEKIGWKLKKGEEKLVQEFCKQVGVERSVFKVWMHNNKHSSSSSVSSSGRREKEINNNHHTVLHHHDHHNHHNHQQHSGNNNHGGTNCGASVVEFNLANGGGHETRAQ